MLIVYSVSFVWRIIVLVVLFCLRFRLFLVLYGCCFVVFCGRFVCFDLCLGGLFSMAFLFVYFDLIVALGALWLFVVIVLKFDGII